MIRRLRFVGIAAFAAAALSSSLARAGEAAPRGDGFLAIDGGLTRLIAPNAGTTNRATEWGGLVSFAFSFTPRLGTQADLVVKRQSWTQDQSPGYEIDNLTQDVAGHFYYRDDHMLVGVLAQIGRDALGAPNSPYVYDVDHQIGGVEAQAFLGDLTLYGQAGVSHFSDAGGEYEDGWLGTFEARYFLTPDLKVEGHAGVETLSNSGNNKGFYGWNTTLTILNAGAGAEYRVADTPFGLFARYDHYHSSSNRGGDDTDDDRVLVGLKLNLDSETLRDRDRGGASLKPFESHALDIF